MALFGYGACVFIGRVDTRNSLKNNGGISNASSNWAYSILALGDRNDKMTRGKSDGGFNADNITATNWASYGTIGLGESV